MIAAKMMAVAALVAGAAQAAVVTNVVVVTAYVYENAHVYVDQNGTPYTTSYEQVSTVAETVPTPTVYTQTDAATTTTPQAAAATSHTHASSSEAANFVQIETTSEEAVPTTTEAAPTTTETPTTTSTTEAAPTTTETPTTTPTPTPTTFSTVVATTSTSSSAPAAESSSSSSGSGETFEGEATYYTPGLGACGWTNSDSDFIAALNVDQFNSFGSMSNGNPVCGKMVEISYNGGTPIQVEITDKCPGCAYGDLDLSPAAFSALADQSLGRIDISWQFAS